MSQAARGAFWAWSLEHYQCDGVEPLLLRLQDEFHFNVNMLLWTCWCATRFEPMTDAVLREAMELTKPWVANVTTPLRAARRYLKSQGAVETDTGIMSLRAAIKDSELMAERIEQSLLEQLASARLIITEKDPAQFKSCAINNLTAYATLTEAAETAGFTMSLLESLASHIFIPAPQSAVIGD